MSSQLTWKWIGIKCEALYYVSISCLICPSFNGIFEVSASILFCFGTVHFLRLRLWPKRNGLGKWFFERPQGWVYIFFISQSFFSIFLIALYWLGNYYFYSAQGWVAQKSYPNKHFSSAPIWGKNKNGTVIFMPETVYIMMLVYSRCYQWQSMCLV